MDVDMFNDSLVNNGKTCIYRNFLDLPLNSLKFHLDERVFEPETFHWSDHQAIHISHEQRQARISDIIDQNLREVVCSELYIRHDLYHIKK